MITLYTFGPNFDLPDASPFVCKAMLLLKLAGLDYREDRGGYRRAPKGKLPVIKDDDVTIPDSTFIRFHIERKYGHDYDAGLSAEQRGTAWAVEKMLEDHLYWAVVHLRWCDAANFARGPARFFDVVPAPVRPLARAFIRRKVEKSTWVHGLGRHSAGEIAELAVRDLDAVAGILGERPWLMGDTPCGADAAVFGMVAGALAPVFDSPIQRAAAQRPNLVAYCERVTASYFPPHSSVAKA